MLDVRLVASSVLVLASHSLRLLRAISCR